MYNVDFIIAVLEDYAQMQVSGEISGANRYSVSDVQDYVDLLASDTLPEGASTPEKMLSYMKEQQRLQEEVNRLKIIAANLATTGAMAVGALPNNSAVARVVVMAVKEYNEYAYRGQDESHKE